MFPIIDPKAKPTTKPKIFVSLLWKKLNHLGNAGFDPEMFRVDPYGNVLFYHADSASPLAWDIDHWFPCSRGGLTVPSNLRILQWQVCKRKHNKLEFLIPWWDFQVGISINQFMSIFASSNSDFRHRAFSWLFSEGESEELNASQTVDSHTFPQHFMELKEKLGLAPAAIVLSRRGSYDAPLKSTDLNRRPRSSTPIIAARKLKPLLKENEDPNMVSNPYQAIVMARDSLKRREETVKMQAEIRKLDNEVNDLQHNTEEEKVTIQDLELVLIKRKRRAEKCRRLAEAQSSYRAMLEKMIRDAMHQSVVYKEQVRLNQAAASALLARLEAQKAICDSAERELHRKYKQRDELEKQIRPEWEQARKRSRMDDDTLQEERDDRLVLYSPKNEAKTQLQIEMNDTSLSPLHQELWKFLEEEQKASDASLLMIKEQEQDELDKGCSEISDKISIKKHEKGNKTMVEAEDGNPIEVRLEKLDIREQGMVCNIQFPIHCEPDEEKDEESRKQRGKGNVEKWLQLLLENTQDDDVLNPKIANENETDELIRKLDLASPEREIIVSRVEESQTTESMEQLDKITNQQLVVKKNNKNTKETVEMEATKSLSNNGKEDGKTNAIANVTNINNTPLKNPPYRLEPQRRSYTNESGLTGTGVGQSGRGEEKERMGKSGKGRELFRSESARAFRRIPSSPSLILGSMKKRVDCIRKKPLVLDDNDVDDVRVASNSFIKSSIETIKRAVKI
ncbi:hypothetical protein Fot_17930 [Forsythia ovata]|uniref:Uncharacterized protein n=1 Tax=Forsythia ovata TaxID=205694 RepID=A0ABD1VGT0_9LAMI